MRLLSRTNLELVGAQMFTPDKQFAYAYAEKLRERSPQNQVMLLSDYIEQNLAPSEGRPHRTLLLLFCGEDPCEKLLTTCGHIYNHNVEVDALTGETIRDTYADLIFSKEDPEKARYFEPAVLTPRNQEEADEDLRLMADFLEGKGNIVQNVVYPDPSVIEQTLAIIKPDNWTPKSSRPGTIIDMFSRTGLRIIGIKVHNFSLAEAMEFYDSVKMGLRKKNIPKFVKETKKLLKDKFMLTLSKESKKALSEIIGVDYIAELYTQIVEYMCGMRPNKNSLNEKNKPGNVKCMILVYEGENAIKKIRDVLGSTDPHTASEGTIRHELGADVKKNAAHASDSTESYLREKEIVRAEENSLCSIIRMYLPVQ